MHGSMHKGDVLPAALIASGMAWLAHRYIMRVGNIMPPPTFPPACVSIAAIWWALLIACMGGIAAALAARRGRGNTTHLGIPFGPFLAYAIYMVFLLQIPGMPWH